MLLGVHSTALKQCKGPCWWVHVASGTFEIMEYDPPSVVGVTDPSIRCQNTVQQLTLWENILKLWIDHNHNYFILCCRLFFWVCEPPLCHCSGLIAICIVWWMKGMSNSLNIERTITGSEGELYRAMVLHKNARKEKCSLAKLETGLVLKYWNCGCSSFECIRI